MKTLYIMRHGHSPAGGEDRLRRLSESGCERVAENAARAVEYQQPQWILASPAQRTRETAEIVANAADQPELVLCASFYQGPPEDYLEQIRSVPADAKSIMVVGHNPAVSHLASLLGERFLSLSPGDVAVFSYDGEWAELSADHSLKLVAHWQV